MSLYFKERIDEQQKEDPSNDKIIFTYPWIITILSPHTSYDQGFSGNYYFQCATWYMHLRHDNFNIRLCNNSVSSGRISDWNGTCFVAFKLYSDNDMKVLLDSTQRIQMIQVQNEDTFETPDGFMTQFAEAVDKRKVAKTVVSIELHLSTKYFYRPFEAPSSMLRKTLCCDYPGNIKDDFRFEFLNKGDMMIKCIDGSVPALRVVLNISCSIMEKYSMALEDHEFIVKHSIDVVKLIITYLHTFCFEMPQLFDLDFVERLFKAIDFFELERPHEIKDTIHQSLCRKFVTKKHTFDTILEWTTFSCKHSFLELQRMIASIIVYKYYFKWQETFPLDTRNDENPLFLDVFGSETNFNSVFRDIDRIYEESLLTKAILQ